MKKLLIFSLKFFLISAGTCAGVLFVLSLIFTPDSSSYPARISTSENSLPYTFESDRIIIGESALIDGAGREAIPYSDVIFFSIGYNEDKGHLFIINVSDSFGRISFLKDYPLVIKLDNGKILELQPCKDIGVYSTTIHSKWLGFIDISRSVAKAFYKFTDEDISAIQESDIVKYRYIVSDTLAEIVYDDGMEDIASLFTHKVRAGLEQSVADYNKKKEHQINEENYEQWKEDVTADPLKDF